MVPVVKLIFKFSFISSETVFYFQALIFFARRLCNIFFRVSLFLSAICFTFIAFILLLSRCVDVFANISRMELLLGKKSDGPLGGHKKFLNRLSSY